MDGVARDANRIGTEATLAELYNSLIEAGSRLYQQNHDPALIRETFEATEENRVAILRAMISQGEDWRTRLPPGYMPALAQLQAAEALWLHQGQPSAPAAVRQLRAELSLLLWKITRRLLTARAEILIAIPSFSVFTWEKRIPGFGR